MLEDKDLVSIQEVRAKVEKAYAAWQKYRHYNQEQIGAIVERMAAAARANAQRLAELAVEETGYGNAKDKLAKNLLCADLLPRRMRRMKTVGVIRELPEEKVIEGPSLRFVITRNQRCRVRGGARRHSCSGLVPCDSASASP
jgi:acyl-CoA reductase-like NAD-dependent aldehyde dehydrogenase